MKIESLKMREINSYTTGGFTCIPEVYPIYKLKTHFLNLQQHETFDNKKNKEIICHKNKLIDYI